MSAKRVIDMDQETFREIQRLYSIAKELAEADREQVLSDSACRPEVIEQVKALLAMEHREATMKLTGLVEIAKQGRSRGKHEGLVGTRLGDYKLTEILGRGGSGVVYLGKLHRERYSARVAIKIIDSTLEPSLQSRFHTEHQILASLSHPHIAKLISVGETTDQCPYLVMEYVHGVPLDKFCDQQTYSIKQRLQLFLKVCAAIQYAHRNLVVHRDLKPSNILVTEDGTPKLLDFGIAKILTSKGGSTEVTRYRDRALTPEYASPEQIRGNPITTASDVYSLGVLLYELLAGLPPYTVIDKNSLELERIICITDAPKPSTAVARVVQDTQAPDYPIIHEAAIARGVHPRELYDSLNGDLDAIVMRAMRKEPDKRYSSVEALIADIENYLSHRPVAARQGNWFYYSERFIRRNAIPTVAISMTVLTLFVAAIVSVMFYHREHIARDRAQAVSTFMTSIFSGATPYNGTSKDVKALDLLYEASARINDLKDDESRLALLYPMGDAYLKLRDDNDAAEHLRQAVTLQRSLHPKDKAKLALILVELATAEQELGTFDIAAKDFTEALKLLQSSGEERSATYAKLLYEVGRMENMRSNLDSAADYYQRSIAVTKQLPGNQSVAIALISSDLAQLYCWSGKYRKAEDTAREAFEMINMELPEMRPERVFIQLKLAEALTQQHRFIEAEPLIERSVSAERTMYHNTGPELATGVYMLAWNREALGRHAEAESLLKESLEIAKQSLGAEHFETGFYLASLARMKVLRRAFADAENYAKSALDIFRKALPADHQYVFSAQYWLGESYLGLGHFSEAKEVLEKSVEGFRNTKAPTWMIVRSEGALNEASTGQGKCKEVVTKLKDVYETLQALRGEEDEATRMALMRWKHCEGEVR